MPSSEYLLRLHKFDNEASLYSLHAGSDLSDWPQMEDIRYFFTSDFSTVWRGEPDCTEIYSEKVPYVPFEADLTQFGLKTAIPARVTSPPQGMLRRWYVIGGKI